MVLPFWIKKYKLHLIFYLIILIAIPVSFYFLKQAGILNPKGSKIPQIYSAVTFNSKQEQTLTAGSFITGKGIPNSQVSITISPNGDHKDIQTGKDGNWSYKIPENLSPKTYNLTVILKDASGNIASIKSYKIKLLNTSSIGWAFVKPVFAQGILTTGQACNPDQDLCSPGLSCQQAQITIGSLQAGDYGCFSKPQTPISNPTPAPSIQTQAIDPNADDYTIWEDQMRAFDIYPAKENGEIVLYNWDNYSAKYCPCLMRQLSSETIITSAESDKILLTKLFDKLIAEGYAPIHALTPYFPNIADALDVKCLKNPVQGTPIGPDCQPLISAKTEIDQAILSQYIKQVWNDLASQKYWAEDHYGDPIKTLITLTDPILGTRSLVDVLTLPPSQVSDDTRANALLGLTFIFGGQVVRVGEKGVAAGANCSGNGPLNCQTDSAKVHIKFDPGSGNSNLNDLENKINQ